MESLQKLSVSKNYHTKQYVIAYSGGVDSLVLLHGFKQIHKQLNVKVRAVHVHHGLQSVADDWVNHCQQSCEQLNIPLDVLYVDAQKKQGDSPEESARNARYQALQKNLTEGDCLVTAQHRNDQAETLLLQLFRTASAAGLSAMPSLKPFADYLHIRPLLSFSRQQIEDYACQNNLQWVEDPSNDDVSFDRNYLRKEILPRLEKRWPEVNSQLATVANLQASNLQVLKDMAAIDLASSLVTKNSALTTSVFNVESILSIEKLKQLSSARLSNLLRYWVITIVEKSPTRNLLEEIEATIINSQPDAKPSISFSEYAFRKFQENLYLIKTHSKINVPNDLMWNPVAPLKLPGLGVQLKIQKTAAKGLDKKLLNESLTVSFRKGGEKFHPADRQHSQSLKKLLQEAGVPPWERDVIPLVYFNDVLIAVSGLWLSKDYSVDEVESGWRVDVKFL